MFDFHLRCLRDCKLPLRVLKNLYSCTTEIILMGNITTWFRNSNMQDRWALQRVVRSAECIIHTKLPDLHPIYSKQCWTKTRKIVKDLSHPNNALFSLLHSVVRFCLLKANTERLRRSFFLQIIKSQSDQHTGFAHLLKNTHFLIHVLWTPTEYSWCSSAGIPKLFSPWPVK